MPRRACKRCRRSSMRWPARRLSYCSSSYEIILPMMLLGAAASGSPKVFATPAARVMAEILSHLDHAPTDAEKTQLRQLASDANLSEQKRTLATAIMHFHHKAADEDKAKLNAIAEGSSAPEEDRELPHILAIMSYHPSA